MPDRSVHIGPRWLLIPLAALAVTWSATPSASEIYKWVDEDGVVHYSDTRPKNDAPVTTIELRQLNPENYDPVTDPYSILNQAKRTNASWTRRVAAQERARSRSYDDEEDGFYATPGYDPWAYYPPSTYYPVVVPPRAARPNPRAARRQLNALDAVDLSGRRPASINSGVHRDRVLRSQALPVVGPN